MFVHSLCLFQLIYTSGSVSIDQLDLSICMVVSIVGNTLPRRNDIEFASDNMVLCFLI